MRSAGARRAYSEGNEKFLTFARRAGLPLDTAAEIDESLERFMEQMFLDGAPQSAARSALYGYAWRHPEMPHKDRRFYVRSRAALAGWRNLEPGGTRDPTPKELAWWIADDLLQRGLVLVSFLVVLCFDCYLRPGVGCTLRRSNVMPPASEVNECYDRWCLRLSPPESGKPSKTGAYDDSIVVGELSDRRWIAEALAIVYPHIAGDHFLFPFGIKHFEKYFKDSADALGIGHLRQTPHCLRHGGPSTDVYNKALSLEEVRRRGKWADHRSVSRYEKHARLHAVFQRLSPGAQRRASAAAATLPDKLLCALRQPGLWANARYIATVS